MMTTTMTTNQVNAVTSIIKLSCPPTGKTAEVIVFPAA
jgi:hypothetical protein